MSIEIFQLLIGAIFTGSIAGLIFVVYKIITEEQEKKLERSKVKLHWKEHRKICEQNLRSRGDWERPHPHASREFYFKFFQ